jgi:glycosyltransferase involved in cell wall biosynthesis
MALAFKTSVGFHESKRNGRAMKGPQRIAFVIDAVLPWHKGGRERRLHEIATRLRRPNREVHIYTMNWWSGPKLIELDGIYYHALCKCYPLYKGNRRSITQAIIFSLALFNLLFEQFDELHVDHMPFFPLYSARVVAWLKRKKLTATWNEVWGYRYWLDYMRGPAGVVGYLVEKISFSLPDSIIAISFHTTRNLRENGARCKIETVPLCVDLRAISAVPPAEIESDVIYVGRLLDHKGVDRLVAAVAMMKQDRPGVRLLIVGGGPEEAKIAQLIRDLGVEDNVRLLGRVDDDDRPYALMKSSKVLVLPSVREGFGLVALEALAAGIPVVTTCHENNATKDLVRDKVNGCLATATAKDLREKIDYVLDMRAQMRPGEGIEQYDWDVAASRYEKILEGEAAA